MDKTMSPAGIVYKLVEEKPGLHAETLVFGKAVGGMTEQEYTRAKRALIRLGLITEIRRRCGGSTEYLLESLSCQRTPFDTDDATDDQATALFRKSTGMDRAFGLDAPDQTIKSADFADTFWSQVDIRDDETCWEWQGLKNSKGYGRVRFNKGDTTAHKIALQLHRGDQVIGQVYHLCGNRLCCNPSHLSEKVPTGTFQSRAVDGNPEDVGTLDGNLLEPVGTLGTHSADWPPALIDLTEDTVEDNTDTSVRSVNLTDGSSSVDLTYVHKLSVSEVGTIVKTIDSPDTDGWDVAQVGWNEPPAYWPEPARRQRYYVFGAPAPVARTNEDLKGKFCAVNPLFNVPTRSDMHCHYGFLVTDGGEVLPLILDFQPRPQDRPRVHPRYSFHQSKLNQAFDNGLIDKWADYRDGSQVPEVPEVPRVPTPTGTAKAVDNTDLLAGFRIYNGVPVFEYDNNDLNCGAAWAYAEEIIRRYRAQTPARQWNPLIGAYPVPEWAEDQAQMIAGKHYWELEIAVGQKLEEATGKPVEFRAVRAFVGASLDLEQNPLVTAESWSNRISDPTAFLCSLTIRMGGSTPQHPTTPRPALLPVRPFGLEEPEVLDVGDHFPKVSAPSTSSPVVSRPKRW